LVEYVSLAVIILGGMFFLLEMSSRLSEDKPEGIKGTDPMTWIKIIYVFAAFLLGLALMGLAVSIANELGASAAVKATATASFWAWASITIITVFMFLIYFIYLIPKWIRASLAASKRREEGDEGDDY
jgi:hypothetical protein